MAYILNIDTSVEGASICLAADDQPIHTAASNDSKETGSWLHPAMDRLMKEAGIGWNELNAIAVAAGPGSYTGLRVGMSAAKGLCFTLKIPLLCISTLQMMAKAAGSRKILLCPMIDARRMEVFTAMYDEKLLEILPVSNIILTPETFSDVLDQQKVSFFGNGSKKFQHLTPHPNAEFLEVTATAADLAPFSSQRNQLHQYDDIAYSEPLYGKDFYSPMTKQNTY